MMAFDLLFSCCCCDMFSASHTYLIYAIHRWGDGYVYIISDIIRAPW